MSSWMFSNFPLLGCKLFHSHFGSSHCLLKRPLLLRCCHFGIFVGRAIPWSAEDGRIEVPTVGFSSPVGRDPSPVATSSRLEAPAQIGGQRQPPAVPKKDSRQDRVEQAPLHPDERMARARVRVGQLLESALNQGRQPSRPCSSKSTRSHEKSTIPGQSSAHRVAPQSRRGVFGQEKVVGGGGGCRGCSHPRSSRSCRGREKFGEGSGGQIEIVGASRFCSNGHFAIKTVQQWEQLQMRVAQLQVQNEEFMFSPQTSRRRVRSRPRPWVPIARRFCSSEVGHARCDNSRECPRVGEILPSCGECSGGGSVTDINSVNGRECCHGSSRKCIGTALCSGEISVRIARSPSGGGFEPSSHEEAPSCDVKPRSVGQ